jgi:hypothetical protein
MPIVMGDAVNPAALPSGLGAYAGYDDGHWPDYLAIKGAHPFVPVVEITVWLSNQGVCLDIENGDAVPAQGPGYVLARAQAGIWRPILYGSRSILPAIMGACSNAGIGRDRYRIWSAHYGQGQHICGPGTCGSSVQADGTQWIDHGSWDESILPDWFFGAPPPSPIQYPPASSGVPYPIPGGDGMNVPIVFGATGDDGTAYVDIPIPGGTTKCIGASVDVADPGVFQPPAHDVDLRPALGHSGAVAQPCVGAQNPGHQRVRLAGGAARHFYTGDAQFA